MIMRRLAVDVAWLFLFGLILLILLILLIIIITITSRGKMTRGKACSWLTHGRYDRGEP